MKAKLYLVFGVIVASVYLGLCFGTALGYISMRLDGVEVEGVVFRFLHALWVMPIAIFFVVFGAFVVAFKFLFSFFV